MGDRRKLQGEIDRCLKKVTEGVETFDDIWQKVHSAPNHNQKDKYEQELKKEIKKLQRLRDQIKAWISSTEIKDKKSLQEARKTIELQMERFKIVERETKTKAYSKEGLGAGQKLDPQEKEKEECNQWIAEAIHELNIQIDKFEADMETLSVALKKKKSDKEKQERLEETKHSIERHKFHIQSLEKILRAINNDALDLKTIHNLRDDIEYYVESNQESDFKENESMYEEIDLENLSTLMTPVIAVATQSYPPSLSNGNSNSTSSTSSTLMDISSSTINIHSLPSHTSERTMTVNSNHGDNESVMGLTTPSSSTQASSPSASPALSLTDDRKRNKSESDDNQSQRNRSNSGVNQGSIAHTTYVSSPKNPSVLTQQSPNISSKTNLSSAPTSASALSSSAPPHFAYPATTSSTNSTTTSTSTSISTSISITTTTTTTTTLPVLQYSAIVSQNASSTLTSTLSTNTTTSNAANTSKPSPHVLSPPNKQQQQQGTRPMSNGNNNDSSSSIITSHPPSLLSTSNDRTGLSNSNIPSEDSLVSSQNVSLLTRSTTSENDRTIPSYNSIPSGLISNGSSETHSSLMDNPMPSISNNSSTPSAFVSNTNTNLSGGDLSTPPNNTNGGVISQLASGIPINPDHPSLRYVLSSTNSNAIHQPTVPTGRVPLTPAEMRMLNRLNAAYTKLPSLLESERQRTNSNRIYGRNPLGPGQIIPYYPQTPPAGSDSAEFYYRLAPDTLFFVFYYMEGTRAQYLAAKALKRQSWRFHTKHMMWFQRHEEPKTITDDYEQGTYIFFDYERWQTRKRDNFMFEYKFLEDREF